MDPTALFSIIHGSAILFQLNSTFIYSIFSNKFSILAKLATSKHTLSCLYERHGMKIISSLTCYHCGLWGRSKKMA